MAEWQTRQLEVLVAERSCRFKSCSRHSQITIRDAFLRLLRRRKRASKLARENHFLFDLLWSRTLVYANVTAMLCFFSGRTVRV
jgi:hypothetical protein